MAVVLPNPRRWDPSKRGRYVERNSARIVDRMAASGLWPDEDDFEDETSTGDVVESSTSTAIFFSSVPVQTRQLTPE